MKEMDIIDYLLAKKKGGGSQVTIEQLNVTENGTYSETGKAYSPVIVEVPAPTLITKTITENGTYNASEDNADGYSQVTVDVEGFKKKSIANTPTDIASFADGTANPMPSLEISIEPVQSGSGDPSPSNVRPISGWSGANVTKCGKNLINISDAVVTSASYLFNGNISLPAGKYVFSITKANTVPSGGDISIAIIMDNGTNATVYKTATEGNRRIIYFEAINKIAVVRVYVVAGDYRDIQLELGSSVTAYEPYQGSTTTIPFHDSSDNPITVYGGRLNVTSGELTATHVSINLEDYASSIFFNTGYNCWVLPITPSALFIGNYDIPNILTSVGYIPRAFYYGLKGDNAIGVTSNGFLFIGNNSSTVKPTGQVVYPLATPQTYQLTPVQVTNLLGQNNIFADCGQILEGEYFVTL